MRFHEDRSNVQHLRLSTYRERIDRRIFKFSLPKISTSAICDVISRHKLQSDRRRSEHRLQALGAHDRGDTDRHFGMRLSPPIFTDRLHVDF